MKAILLFVTVSFCSKLIQGSCLSYGHSCWGAHGKRSSTPPINLKGGQHRAPPDQWALFKAIADKNDIYNDNRINAYIPVLPDELAMTEPPVGAQESDMGMTESDNVDDDLASKQMPSNAYKPPRNRRRPTQMDEDDDNRLVSLTPEEFLTAHRLRLFDFLMKRDNLQYPRQKHA